MRDLKLSFNFWFYINVTILLVSIVGCSAEKMKVDKIIFANAIYVCDSSYSIAEAMVILDGKILDFGSKEEILSKYEGNKINYKGTIFPGFIDAHSHFYGYALTLTKADLRNTTSMEHIVEKLGQQAKSSEEEWITGRGWDQTKWEAKGNLSNNILNAYFPNRPVFIKRIDGHLGLANQKALELAGITKTTQVNGGEIEVVGGRLTGVLMDNAMELVDKVIPEPKRSTEIATLIKAQANCFAAGLTTVTDAGLDLDKILLIDSLQKSGDLSIRIYAMANPNEENFKYFEEHGAISTEKLQVSSFKLYADGSLGSRGAKLKQSYCDHENYTGIWVTAPEELEQLCNRINDIGFQVNTHCIGDSANKKTLEIYSEILEGNNDKRWRIEHAQVVTPSDRKMFADYDIIPSVQPTHATSDMHWASDRLCADRMDGAYAYKSLLAATGYIPLGTDFPVEEIYPLATYLAAVYRQNGDYKPLDGFLADEALTPSQAILGMTRWAAIANRMEDRIGSLEKGKLADFVVLSQDITQEKYMIDTEISTTFLAGKEMQ